MIDSSEIAAHINATCYSLLCSTDLILIEFSALVLETSFRFFSSVSDEILRNLAELVRMLRIFK